ncbi:TetR/AcrR family transcriptional regulator C-terminal domain-containing protein [Aquibium sp. A9E412]|uniref:TetR/AcrR family transcriptional regulator C-terminal domain-containing protein n=1 Tax=Aquibium sp. A9E412 TaxID=2976767 RepID=UPI0025AEF052|nr:TetR/AcrR family transcriptional regulator C-terminal domain-containing protein [Aquibium sp. A9E412]MDN2566135.1 TetR/AcrR family transcriptional regulator C-terminal domain-containing protein [Aquibium sp. A9E412]
MVIEVGDGEGLSARQRQVLDAALALLVAEGDRLTMTGVARCANCSKETLYKWFGGRDGLLTAIVQWQASGVRIAPVGTGTIDRPALAARLERFAADWLAVITSPTSVALNRLAVGHAGTGEADLGRTVLANGRFALARRLKPVLEAARAAGLVAFDDAEEAFRTFFGLVVRDVQIRLLLGDRARPEGAAIAADAARATTQFLALYGVRSRPARAGQT